MSYIIVPVLLIILAAASIAGIIVSAIKLRGLKEAVEGKRAPWIILIVLCSIYLALFIAGIIFLIMIMVSITVNGM